MKHAKLFKRVALSLTSLFVLMLGSLLIFLETGSSIYLSDKTKQKIIWKVREAPELPQNFIDFYNKVYLSSLEKGVWNWVFSKFNSNGKSTKCPCATLAYNRMLYESQPEGVGRIVAHLSVALQFEEIFTQTECLNYLTHSHDFLRNVEGIHAASKFYLNKELHKLNEIEMAELIARMENPLHYDREKNPWNLDRKINLLLKQTNYAE